MSEDEGDNGRMGRERRCRTVEGVVGKEGEEDCRRVGSVGGKESSSVKTGCDPFMLGSGRYGHEIVRHVREIKKIRPDFEINQ